MVKVTHAPARRKRKKKVFKMVKGARGGRRKLWRTARESSRRSLKYSYRDRRVKKRTMRGLWIVRINARLKEKGLSYSRFINGLKKAKIALDRKMLAELAAHDTGAFDAIVDAAMKQ